MSTGLRAQPSLTPMHRGRLPACSCRHARVDGLHRPSGRTASRITPSPIMSPIRSHPGSWTEIRLGVRARTTRTTNQPHAPPATTADPFTTRIGLTLRACTDKEQPPIGSRGEVKSGAGQLACAVGVAGVCDLGRRELVGASAEAFGGGGGQRCPVPGPAEVDRFVVGGAAAIGRRRGARGCG